MWMSTLADSSPVSPFDKHVAATSKLKQEACLPSAPFITEQSESGTVLFLFFLSALVGVEWGSQLTAGQTEGLLWDVVAIPLCQVAFKCSLQVKGQVLPTCHLLCPLHSLSKHI